MMNNQFLRGEIEREVCRRVARGALFTALDISRAVQAAGVRERHRNLKSVVHALWARGEMGRHYGRTLIRFGGGEEAFLYHPANVDPRSYDTGAVNHFATAPRRACVVEAARSHGVVSFRRLSKIARRCPSCFAVLRR